MGSGIMAWIRGVSSMVHLAAIRRGRRRGITGWGTIIASIGRIWLRRVMAVLVRVIRRGLLLTVVLTGIAAAAAAVRRLLMVLHLSKQS
jgi:hypothetical protein